MGNNTVPLIEKVVIRLMILPVCLIFGLLSGLIGFMSPHRLGVALEETGQNLQQYRW